MSKNEGNRRRAFADVVTIDAWHEPFNEQTSEVDLHAYVVFGTARIGGEDTSPVRFKLSLRRAEVVVVIPDHEPVTVRKSSVSRDAPQVEARSTETIEKQHSRSGGFSAKAHSKGLLGATANLAASGKLVQSKTIEKIAVLTQIVATQTINSDGHYRWELSPLDQKTLQGPPWDTTHPRLRLVDQRPDKGRSLPPTVRVEVRCRREDIFVEDIEVKDRSAWKAIRHKDGFKNRLAAAICQIRRALVQEGLEAKGLDDPYGELILSSVTAEPS